jgi:hypothetical protein
MLPLSSLPWNTIGIAIGLSLLIPSVLSVILIKKHRYEELGWTIGIFLLLLGTITYFVIIPQMIVDEAILPEDYIWEDEGTIYYWEKNSVISPRESKIQLPPRLAERFDRREPIELTFPGKEIIKVTHIDKDNKEAVIQDSLLDEDGEIFQVINGLEPVSEWYTVDARLTSLEYSNIHAGHMGIPSNSENIKSYPIGWVESGGIPDGDERLVFLRNMIKIRSGTIDDITFDVWESTIFNQQISWHGEDYYCDETLRLTVNPQTGYIIHVYRHLVLSAHLSQFIKLYYPSALDSRLITRFLSRDDPIGEAAILEYQTTETSQANHIAELKSFDDQLNYLPIVTCVPLVIIGILLFWRYGGRGYYWRKYKEFER